MILNLSLSSCLIVNVDNQIELFKVFLKTAAGGSDFVFADTTFHRSIVVVT